MCVGCSARSSAPVQTQRGRRFTDAGFLSGAEYAVVQTLAGKFTRHIGWRANGSTEEWVIPCGTYALRTRAEPVPRPPFSSVSDALGVLGCQRCRATLGRECGTPLRLAQPPNMGNLRPNVRWPLQGVSSTCRRTPCSACQIGSDFAEQVSGGGRRDQTLAGTRRNTRRGLGERDLRRCRGR